MKKIYSENLDDTRNKITALTHIMNKKWNGKLNIRVKENRIVHKMSLF